MSHDYVTVQTGARLHFGPLSYLPERGRHFGGIGMMINRPGVKLAVSRSQRSGETRCASLRAKGFYDHLSRCAPWGREPVEIDVSEEIPSHCGLGSGTQLALALGDALAMLHDRRFTPAQLAQMAGRGERSAIGLQGYELGGFLIDAGRLGETDVGAMAVRLPFPEHWRILLIRTVTGSGLHGDLEMNAFRNLPPMSEAITGRLCRLALTEILPSLQQHDFAAFTAALYEFGFHVGTFFSGAQQGVFSSPVIRSLATRLPVAEIGMAQSSWGPTVALFAENDEAAKGLWRRVKSGPEGDLLQVELVTARNQGREINRHRSA